MKRFGNKQTDIFEILSKTISEGIVIVDDQQKIMASNKAANTMFGYADKELIGRDLEILIPEKYKDEHYQKANAYMGSTKARKMGHGRNLSGQKKTGETFPVEAGLNPFKIDQNNFVMALVTDISVRKKQEEEILRLNSRLGQIVEERTKELQKIIYDLREEVSKRKEAESKIKVSLEKERELNELKTKFLSLVSHEFKTPLSVILSSATLAGKYTKTEQQDKRDKHLKTIKLQVKTLNNILDDFLSIERLNSGENTYKIEDFPLIRLINSVIYDANMLSKEGQKIIYPDNIDSIIVHNDEKILESTLTNLVNNAIKYSPEYSTIDVSVEVKNDTLNISVKDEGIGIPTKEQKHIFNPYFRADNALLQKGTGIGLNIVKGHLEKLDSLITFESKENTGSTFTITIPHTKN